MKNEVACYFPIIQLQNIRFYMQVNVRSTRSSGDLEHRRHYKTRADEVLLSRNYNTASVAEIKFERTQSDEEIFGILLACQR